MSTKKNQKSKTKNKNKKKKKKNINNIIFGGQTKECVNCYSDEKCNTSECRGCHKYFCGIHMLSHKCIEGHCNICGKLVINGNCKCGYCHYYFCGSHLDSHKYNCFQCGANIGCSQMKVNFGCYVCITCEDNIYCHRCLFGIHKYHDYYNKCFFCYPEFFTLK